MYTCICITRRRAHIIIYENKLFIKAKGNLIYRFNTDCKLTNDYSMSTIPNKPDVMYTVKYQSGA